MNLRPWIIVYASIFLNVRGLRMSYLDGNACFERGLEYLERGGAVLRMRH